MEGKTPQASHRIATSALLLTLLSLSIPVAAQAPAAPPPSAAPPAPAAPARPQPRFTILLDAAHGGDDNGGQIGAAVAEKTITLALSVRLRSLLAARGFSVVTTRESNLALDADARAQIANHAQPAACLVLHATESGSGVHLFTSAIAPTQPTRFLAWKTAQSAYVTHSIRLAGALNAAFAKGADAVLPTTLARATLPGLDSLACPAVVLELAPERSSDGAIAADVTDPAYQAQVADTIASAMLAWKSEWEADHTHSPTTAGERP
ncbi:MAG TPA: N-acetylmuramoyl-L-alanine amidase [Acidobacteriaceae bacterium]|nr:N-acetylmuramoyl-L-alanine amidase [Acidobacteriaceae bacterium]